MSKYKKGIIMLSITTAGIIVITGTSLLVIQPKPTTTVQQAPARVLTVKTPAPKPVVKKKAPKYVNSWSAKGVINGVNKERKKKHLPPLRMNYQLNKSARSKAVHMCRNNYWAHTSPKGVKPWYFIDKAGYNYRHAGENLAMGYNNVTSTIKGWVGSPTHYRNMVATKYRDIGSAAIRCSKFQGMKNVVIVVNHFGKR